MQTMARPSALASTWLPRDTWTLVESAMQGAGRHYHNLDHLDAMVRMAEQLGHEQLPFWRELVAAILFHDLIYDPTRTDNEERSAARVSEILNDTDVNVDDVARAILATRHHRPDADDGLSTTLSDLDMAILSADDYRGDYAVLIRREYAHVPLEIYVAARVGFLRSCLDARIYFAPQPGLFTDDKAHANIAEEIAQLVRDPSSYLGEAER